MALLAKPDIQFARDDANRFLPWMIALMSGMAALMLCLGLTIRTWIGPAELALSNTLTVQFSAPADTRDQAAQKALSIVEKLPQAKSARLLSTQEVVALVKPWLGLDDEAMKALDLPVVVEAALSSPLNQAQTAALSRRLKPLSESLSVDTRAQWAQKFSHLAAAVETILYALAVIIVAALVGMMVFTARAAMKLHEGTVRLLHAIGADDRYIARQFQQNALNLSLRGAVPGAVLAAAGYLSLGLYVARLNAPALPGLSFTPAHAIMLVLLPIVCAGVAWLAVRTATLSQLAGLP